MADEKQNTEHLRAQAALLLSQARGDAFDINRALAAAGGNASLRARLAAAAAQMSAVASELSQALTSTTFPLRQGDLAAVEAIVASGETGALMAEAAAEAATNARLTVTTTAAVTRQEVRTLASHVFDRHIFNPYLRFASPEDEEDFRKREAEAKRYVTAQLARGTPEGDLNAGGGMAGQMLDAHAHGAGASPDFLPRWNALAEKIQRQHAAMRASGQSTEEFDRHVSASVRSFLKAKGLSNADIDERLAASDNPLDAAKPFLEKDSDSRALERKLQPLSAIQRASSIPLARVETSTTAEPADAPSAINLADMTAKLQASGVIMSDNTDAADAGHGLSVQKPATKAVPAIGG